jgi:hypothetical protein
MQFDAVQYLPPYFSVLIDFIGTFGDNGFEKLQVMTVPGTDESAIALITHSGNKAFSDGEWLVRRKDGVYFKCDAEYFNEMCEPINE